MKFLGVFFFVSVYFTKNIFKGNWISIFFGILDKVEDFAVYILGKSFVMEMLEELLEEFKRKK